MLLGEGLLTKVQFNTRVVLTASVQLLGWIDNTLAGSVNKYGIL